MKKLLVLTLPLLLSVFLILSCDIHCDCDDDSSGPTGPSGNSPPEVQVDTGVLDQQPPAARLAPQQGDRCQPRSNPTGPKLVTLPCRTGDTDVVRYDGGAHGGSQKQRPINVDLPAKRPRGGCFDRVPEAVQRNRNIQAQHRQPGNKHPRQYDSKDHGNPAGKSFSALFHPGPPTTAAAICKLYPAADQQLNTTISRTDNERTHKSVEIGKFRFDRFLLILHGLTFRRYDIFSCCIRATLSSARHPGMTSITVMVQRRKS